jgi:putative holliday junction resolvase
MKVTTSPPFTKPRTVLGFDFGLHHIGVAVGQEITHSASPLTTLIACDGKPRWDQITALLEQWQPDLLVVGLPFNMDGSEQPLTEAARRFGNRLHGRYGLPVEWIDERLSTVEARERLYLESHFLGRHRDLDQLAAQCILQTWLREQPTTRT